MQRGKLTLLLLLNLGLLGSATSSGSTASSSGGGGTATRADVREKVLHILALKSLQCNKCPSQSTCPIPISVRPIANSCVCCLGLRTLANNEAQIGSTSTTLAALMRVEILSAWGFECQLSAARGGSAPAHLRSGPRGRGRFAYGDLNTVVGEDQRRVGSGQLSVRHFDCGCRGARCCDSKGLLTWDVQTELEIRERENN